MDRDSCFRLGYIVRPHGLKGEVKAVLETEQPDIYLQTGSVFVEQGQTLVPFFIDAIRRSGNHFILGFEGIETIEEAESLKGTALWMPDSLLPELEEDEFYFHEIIGFRAIDEEKGELGTISDYYSNGPQDLLAIDAEGKEILIPVHESFIKKLDKKNKKILFTLPEGLTDLNIV